MTVQLKLFKTALFRSTQMPQKADHTHHILEGQAVLYQRIGTPHWQVRYKIGSKWLRGTTKQSKLADAKKAAVELIVDAKFREKNDLPVLNKRFKAVANLAIKRMNELNAAGQGKPTFKQYIHAINKYLIPYFGRHNIDKVDYLALTKFMTWRKEEMGKDPSASAINTHNSALNRVFDEAMLRGFITKSQLPHIENKGVASERRPDFTKEEYELLIKEMRAWAKEAREGNEKLVRNLLRDYVLVLANSGMRAGTEAMNLKWQHISLVKKGATQYLLLNINGKTGHREVPVRNSVATYLRRIQLNDPELKDISFEELLKKGVNKYVFRINDEDATTKFGRVFKRLLEKTELLIDKRTGKERTLYSLRHYYATRTLTFNQITPYQLAEQMGTSVGMIEKHYGHLNLHNIADKFAGGGTIEGAIGRGKLAKSAKKVN